MSGIFTRYRTLLRSAAGIWLIASALLWMSGCAAVRNTPLGAPDGRAPDGGASDDDVHMHPVSEPALADPTSAEVAIIEPSLAIIVDAEYADFRSQSYVFAARLARPYRLYEMSRRSTTSLFDDLQRQQPDSVIALGASALKLAARLKGADVVYAGVLNPDGVHRGVQALPPFAMQLDHWRSIAPGLHRIGVIGSRVSRQRIEEIASACEAAGVQLDHREVSSDREMLLAFRSMLPHIDGFVLLPDPEILSPEVIRRTINHGVVNDLQILVYSPFMYELGASLFVETEPVDVALQVIALLESKDSGRTPTKLQVRSNRARSTVAIDG